MLPPRWSWSSLSIYRTCHFWAKLRYIDRLPLPPRDDTAANERGVRMHKGAEDFVFNGAEFPAELTKFQQQLHDARDVHHAVPGAVRGEAPLYFNANWKPCDEANKWLTIIPDLTIVVPREFNVTVDYKSGKRYGNEIKHHGQGQLYAIGQWCTDASFDVYEAEFWYLDLGQIWPMQFYANQLEHARAKLDAEVNRMFEDKFFRPSPSKQNCRYCPYAPHGTGACPVGVTK